MVKVDSYNRDTVLYTKFYYSHNLTSRTFSCDYAVTVYELDSDDNIINKYYDVPCWLIDAGSNIDGQLSYDLMITDKAPTGSFEYGVTVFTKVPDYWLYVPFINKETYSNNDLLLFDVNTGDSVFVSDLLDKTHKWVIRGELFDNTEYSADRAFLKFCSF